MTTLIDRRQSVGFDPVLLDAGRYSALAPQMRGRGARNNQSGRYERQARALFDDGWETLEELPPLKTTVFIERRSRSHPQPIARYFLRPLDQSLSRLRAWLFLLLCEAHPRLYGPVAGPRFRKQAVRQDQCGGTAAHRIVGTGLCAQRHGARLQHRSLSADRARIPNHRQVLEAFQIQSSGGHRRKSALVTHVSMF
jgi:hypothetical protein